MKGNNHIPRAILRNDSSVPAEVFPNFLLT